ncbi:MAG: cysteine hydrolase family protein [Nitrososphaerales archaeon]
MKWHLDPKTTVLLVIDMQNDYVHPNGIFGKAMGKNILKIRSIIKPLQKLILKCTLAHIRVVYIQSTRTEANCEVNRHKILPPRISGWLGGPKKGTWGADIIKEVRPIRGNIIVEKHRNSAFYRTSLERFLKRKNIDTILFTGIATNGCVESTLRDAFFRDFDVVLIDDCCADQSRMGHLSTLRVVRDFYGAVIDSGTVIKEINKHSSIRNNLAS